MFNIKSLAALALSTMLFACAGPSEEVATSDAAETTAPVNDAPLTVVAIAKVTPDTVDQFTAAAAGLVKGSRDEPGNLGYTMLADNDDPTEFVFIEKWASQAASDAHMHGAVLTTFFGAVKDDFEPGYPILTNLSTVDIARR